MNQTGRIIRHPEIMGGKPCIRGMRVTVDVIVGLLESGDTREDVLKAYPYLEDDDLTAALEFHRESQGCK